MPRYVSVLGDSISTLKGWNPEGFAVFYEDGRDELAGLQGPQDTWWGKVISHLNGTLLVNGSWSGSMVQGQGYPAAWSPERIAALARDGIAPDDILVFLGTNDYGWATAAAQACGRSSAAPACLNLEDYPESVAGAAPAGALDIFKDAYATMLHALREAYPQARVWCLTLLPGRVMGASHPTHAWNLRGINMRAYCDAILEVAEACGCTGLDVAGFGFDYEALEGTHPTNLGMSQIADMVVAAMEKQPLSMHHFAPDVSTHCDVPVDWRSKDLCGARMCVGCPWAKGTGNAWYTVCQSPEFK